MLFKNVKPFNLKTKFKLTVFYQPRHIHCSSETNVVRSVVPDIKIPRNMLVEEYVWGGLEKWHDKTALVCAETGRSYTYHETYKKSRRVAHFLWRLPTLRQGDTAAIVLPNCPDFAIAVLGAMQAGLKITSVNTSYTSREMHKQILASDTKVIFVSPEYWSKVREAMEYRLNILIIIIDNKNNVQIPQKAIRFSEILENKDELKYSVPRSANDIIYLPYSSGTTGIPKGVELTNSNLISNLHQMNDSSFKLQSDTSGDFQEVALCVVPWFHIYGQTLSILSLLSSGCKLVTVKKFQPQLFVDILKEYKPTFAHLVPPLILFLNNNVEPEHIASLSTVVSAAAPLSAADTERLLEKNKQLNIFQAYGLTETSPMTHCQTKRLSNGVKMGGSGLLAPNTECKIVAIGDETNAGLGPNQLGEILIRGPQVMRGYYKNPEATRTTLEPDGWLRTGDIGYYDKDEHFFITERLKELIKVKGLQVAPVELEELLRDYPHIEDAAVVGIPHAEFGEIPKAYVVLKRNAKFDASEIQKYVSNNVAKHKQLRGGVVAIDSIPRNPSGKILRKHLKRL